jgi:hypothetical protein
VQRVSCRGCRAEGVVRLSIDEVQFQMLKQFLSSGGSVALSQESHFQHDIHIWRLESFLIMELEI